MSTDRIGAGCPVEAALGTDTPSSDRAGHDGSTVRADTDAGIGVSAPRPDGIAKATGSFAYASDLAASEMLHAAGVRSPHARARIRAIDTAGAEAIPGVWAVLTHRDVPGVKHYGLDVADQPVLAADEVRYWGEPVAIVAAEDEDTARRAAASIAVDYEPLEPLTDPRRAAFDPGAPRIGAEGNLVRHQPIRVGDPEGMHAEIVVVGEYEVGMQDQAPLGPEAALAFPLEDGVEIHAATQWLHSDRAQIAPCLGLAEERVRLVLAGVGGAFGAREDLSVQIHAAMLALRTGRPVRMVLNRAESFVGHVHRHPARMRYEHGATAAGKLVYVKAEIILDGGAYTSATGAVVGNAASLSVGPYRVPHVQVDAYGVRTNNPPCGAMRGFGAVQTCFGYESQMDKIAERAGLDPLRVRALNVVQQGSTIATGQVIEAPAPLSDMLERARELPLPDEPDGADPRDLPGGLGETTRGEGLRRGIGYAVGIKNICYSEGFDDYSTARVKLSIIDGEPLALVHTAAAEVGQGGVTVQAQIARTELGVHRVCIARPDTTVGSAGSTSASRQTYMTGGAVKAACEAVRHEVLDLAARIHNLPIDDLSIQDEKLFSVRDGVITTLAELLGDREIELVREFHHHRTTPLDPRTGQGVSHTQFAYCVHRAVVDVDTELGLIRVVELAAVQDVGKILNRQSIEGQIHGGSAQGLGLALMEEILVTDGAIRNPGFTDYLIPTTLDMPTTRTEILENPDPRAPYGLRGVGEPPTLSATPAIVAAVRAATGRAVFRVPVRPWDLVGA